MYISEHIDQENTEGGGRRKDKLDASTEMQKHVNRMAFGVAQKAVQLSRHAKRKTVDISDIRLACG